MYEISTDANEIWDIWSQDLAQRTRCVTAHLFSQQWTDEGGTLLMWHREL